MRTSERSWRTNLGCQKKLENFERFWLEIDESRIWWRDEKRESAKKGERMKSVGVSRIFEIIINIFLFLGYLHFSPSTSQSLPIKVLRLSI